ncbi:MAG: alpha-amylase family glycosyl hydrolase [Thermomicrobiales bacterium]
MAVATLPAPRSLVSTGDRHWSREAVVYHIYPLGLLDAPRQNTPGAPVESRLSSLAAWGPHIRDIGANAVYLGPVFESATHGYDTLDYRTVDRRLGTNDDLKALVASWHAQGIRVILDGVLNHVSRDAAPFRDLRERGEASAYRDWFANVRFGQRSPLGDPFTYEGWSFHYELAKLNLANPDVRAWLFDAVRFWFREFGIDGLRLDAADVMDKAFLRDLAAVCREENPDCFLVGEVVHGDYRHWAGPGMLDSVTNYQAFKALHSSLNDRNLFEVAHAFNREFGPEGMYRHLPLYNFADNHDVDRVASQVRDPADLYPLYAMLFTMPGIPSIYYASEWGYQGEKRDGWDDGPLRPAFAMPVPDDAKAAPDLEGWIARLAEVRAGSPALLDGDYAEAFVKSAQFAYLRRAERQAALVALNVANDPVTIQVAADLPDGTPLTDALDATVSATVHEGAVTLELPARTVRILLVETA